MAHLVDEGINDRGNRGSDYWPTEAAPAPSWWSKSNWFRIKEDTQTAADAQPATAAAASSVSSSPPVYHLENSTRVEYGGVAEPTKNEKHVPGFATAFNRFINNTQTATPVANTTVAAAVPKRARIAVSCVRGYGAEVMKRIHELIVLPLCHSAIFKAIGIKPARGLIFSGVPGSGKSELIKAIVAQLGVYYQQIDGHNLLINNKQQLNLSTEYPNEHVLETVFRVAIKNAPAIIFIDDVDCIGQSRQAAESANMTAIRGVLKRELDKLAKSTAPVLVIGATNVPDSLDASLMKAGRFEKHIALNKPDKAGRLHMIKECSKDMKIAEDVNFDTIAEATVGFVGSDLQSLCTEAGLYCIREQLRAEAVHDGVDSMDIDIPLAFTAPLDNIRVHQRHFDAALLVIKPSAAREFQLDIPAVKWSDVGGAGAIKQNLIETVEYPVKFGPVFRKFGLAASSGVLLYGPPGTGKTLMAKAIATECAATFISVKGPELLSAFLGESEKRVRELFSKARASSPCVIFFDEFDSIAQARQHGGHGDATGDRVLTQLLTELDYRANSGRNKDTGKEEERVVFVVAATNRPEIIDPAVLRPGRFDQLLFVGLPDEESRMQILTALLADSPVEPAIDSVYLASLASRTSRLSGADLAGLVNQAKRAAIRAELSGASQSEQLLVEYFETALAACVPSVSDDELERFKWFNAALKGNSRPSRPARPTSEEGEEAEEAALAEEETRRSIEDLKERLSVQVRKQVEGGASPQEALEAILGAFRGRQIREQSTTDNQDGREERKIGGIAMQ